MLEINNRIAQPRTKKKNGNKKSGSGFVLTRVVLPRHRHHYSPSLSVLVLLLDPSPSLHVAVIAAPACPGLGTALSPLHTTSLSPLVTLASSSTSIHHCAPSFLPCALPRALLSCASIGRRESSRCRPALTSRFAPPLLLSPSLHAQVSVTLPLPICHHGQMMRTSVPPLNFSCRLNPIEPQCRRANPSSLALCLHCRRHPLSRLSSSPLG